MPTKQITPLPAAYHPRRFVDPAELGSTADQPVDPARVNPLHLPALAHVAADLDGLNVPIRVVPPVELGACEDCVLDTVDGTARTAVATVVAVDRYDFRYRTAGCALHLESLVRWHTRRECAVKVEVPAHQGRDFYERSPRETFYAVSAHDPMTGVAATRGMWDAWQVVEVVDGFGSARVLAPVGLRDGESFDACRERAEVLAQAYAAVLAVDAYEAAQDDAVQGDVETVELPVVTVERAA